MNMEKHWLITGVAGFIGSHLLEKLLSLNQKITGLDNFSTGHKHNLEDVKKKVGEDAWKNFNFVEGDIRNLDDCRKALKGVELVLHQAAIGSVPRSIEDPLTTHCVNVDGFLNMFVAAKDANVKRFVYASSSSVYGDIEESPKVESRLGNPLSPYAVSKRADELYALACKNLYPLKTVGLRYFNVFGARQDPKGAYAAVVPKWIAALLNQEKCIINGDGETSRDFCHVSNVVEANILAATTEDKRAVGEVFNIACGGSTSLNELYKMIQISVSKILGRKIDTAPIYGDFRAGDVRHSLANIDKAKDILGFVPKIGVAEGIEKTYATYR